jgi:hypothetical protein
MICESVYDRGREEADRHKWLASEKAGYDLGKEAIEQWCRKYWHEYLRHRWAEHVRGVRFWREIDRGDFGVLTHRFLDEPQLVKQIVDRLIRCEENLDVINWALNLGLPIERVVEILEALDINSRRLDDILEHQGYMR